VWLPGVTAGSGCCPGRVYGIGVAVRLGPRREPGGPHLPVVSVGGAVPVRWGGRGDLPDVGAAVVRQAYRRRCTMTGGAARRGGPRRRGGAV